MKLALYYFLANWFVLIDLIHSEQEAKNKIKKSSINLGPLCIRYFFFISYFLWHHVLHLFIQEIFIECLLYYNCSRYCVQVKMHLNLYYLGRANTNGLYLFGVSSIALKGTILWSINRGETWYKPHVWDVVNSFILIVYLYKKHLLTRKLLCARQRSSHWGCSCGQDLAYDFKDNTVQLWF